MQVKAGDPFKGIDSRWPSEIDSFPWSGTDPMERFEYRFRECSMCRDPIFLPAECPVTFRHSVVMSRFSGERRMAASKASRLSDIARKSPLGMNGRSAGSLRSKVSRTVFTVIPRMSRVG